MVLVAAGSEAAKVRALREEGYVTIMALEADCLAEARRLGCDLLFVEGNLGLLREAHLGATAPADPQLEALGQRPGLPC